MKTVALLALMSFTLLQGCSVFKDATQTVKLQCAEPGITVMINGQHLPCPGQLETKRNRDFTIQAQKAEYAPYMRTVGHHFSVTGALDVLGTFVFILPAIGVLTPGAWDLDETVLTIQLMPISPQASPGASSPKI